MLNTFPILLAFGLLAPFILRMALGFIFINFGYSKITRQKAEKTILFESIGLRPGVYYVWIIGLLEIVIGVLLVAGLFTQIAALLAMLILVAAMRLKKTNGGSFESTTGYLFLCFIIALSLIFSGAGFLAFDLPL